MTSVALIGAGVIGETIISSLVENDYDPRSITIVEKRQERIDELRSAYGVQAAELADAVGAADLVLLIVKPQDMGGVLEQLAGIVRPQATVVSLAAGITTARIEETLGESVAVVRVMPNTPAVVGHGMFVASPGTGCDETKLEAALDLLRGSGRVVVVPEDQQDAATALSGSGPAYVFLLAEAMQAAGEAIGLPADTARELTAQTVFGAAQMIRAGDAEPATLRERVTSPGGTTAAALGVLDEHGLRETFVAALTAARDRSRELAS